MAKFRSTGPPQPGQCQRTGCTNAAQGWVFTFLSELVGPGTIAGGFTFCTPCAKRFRDYWAEDLAQVGTLDRTN